MCGKDLSDKYYFYEYQRKHQPDKKHHICSICNKSLDSTILLRLGELTHPEDYYEINRSTSRGLKTISYLQKDFQSHTGDMPFTCSVSECDKTFTSQNSLLRHENTHAVERAYSK